MSKDSRFTLKSEKVESDHYWISYWTNGKHWITIRKNSVEHVRIKIRNFNRLENITLTQFFSNYSNPVLTLLHNTKNRLLLKLLKVTYTKLPYFLCYDQYVYIRPISFFTEQAWPLYTFFTSCQTRPITRSIPFALSFPLYTYIYINV